MLRRRRRCGGACWRRESVLSGVAGFVTPGLRRGAHHCTCTVHERYAQQRALQPEYTPTGRNHDGLSKARFPRCCQVDEDHQHRSLTGSYPQGRRHGRICNEKCHGNDGMKDTRSQASQRGATYPISSPRCQRKSAR